MPSGLAKHRLLLHFLFLVLIPVQALAQRVFVHSVQGVNRSYLLYSNSTNNDYNSNRPVVIVLHRNGETARDAFLKGEWQSIKKPTIFIFPNAFKKQWSCAGDTLPDNDIQFLRLILSETYNNFHHDRNRVFVLSDRENECIAENFQKQFPKVLSGFETWKPGVNGDSLAMLNGVQHLLGQPVRADTTYSIWSDPMARKRMDPIDSLKEYRLHNRLVIEVRYGGFAMLGSVRTGIVDGTYARLYKSHSFLDVHLTKWMNDSMAWFIDVGRLNVPLTQETTASGNIRTGGGMIMPITLGFKYALPRVRAHPYFVLGSGMMQVMVFGGRLTPGSMTSGIRPNLDAEMRAVLHTTIGTGIDLRFTKRLTLGAHLRYIHSANFKSAGQVDAIRGFNLNLGLGYIINANSMKKLPFPLTKK